jgi:hypothetical protein
MSVMKKVSTVKNVIMMKKSQHDEKRELSMIKNVRMIKK